MKIMQTRKMKESPAPPSATKWDDEDDSEREKVRRRSRSGSVASASLKPSVLAAPATTKKNKRYKDQGVQTTIETREQGIQVDPPVKPDRNPKKSPMVGKRYWPPATTTGTPTTIGNDNLSTVGWCHRNLRLRRRRRVGPLYNHP
jgi:hypothetical protein